MHESTCNTVIYKISATGCMTYMKLSTNDSFLCLQLFLLSCPLLQSQSFHFLFALLQFALQRLHVCLVNALVVYNQYHPHRSKTAHTTPRLKQSVACLIFYNLKKLELIFVILSYYTVFHKKTTLYTVYIPKVLASKLMHSIPPHLSSDHTLPRNTLTTRYACWMH